MKKINFITPYGSALALIAENPSIRIGELATRFQLTERGARRVISDLVQAGYLRKSRQGYFIGESTDITLIEAISTIEKSESTFSYPEPKGSDNKRQQTTNQLVKAIETLTSKGLSFWELSVEDIIAQAQISRSTFYLHFQDKATLLEIMLENVMTELLGNLSNRDALVESKSQDDLANILKEIFKSYWPHRHILSAAIEAGHNYPGISQTYRKYIQRAIAFLSVNISRKAAITDVNTSLSNEWCSIFITWGIEDCLNNFYSNASPENLDKLSDALAETTWSLLFSNAPQKNKKAMDT